MILHKIILYLEKEDFIQNKTLKLYLNLVLNSIYQFYNKYGIVFAMLFLTLL